MALPGLFPIYPNPIPMLYQVSLSLPMPEPSKISLSIGVTASYPFLVPNVDFLQSFIKGDIGIADKIMKEAMFKSFNNPIAQKDDKVFKNFAKISGVNVPDVNKYKKDGKIKLPKEDVVLPPMDGIGFKGFEKTMLTSIFETQKPYFEVAKLVISNIAKIEDIIARVMPLLGIPLSTKSLKPVGNVGVSGGRPKAIGYQNGKEIKVALAKLQEFTKSGSKVKIDKYGNVERIKDPAPDNPIKGGPDSSEDINGNKKWEVVSTVYSTGVFKTDVEYKYIYIDLPPEKENPEETVDLNLEDDDPYNKYKPEKIILGIFRSDGTPLNPNEVLKTVGLDSNFNIVNVDTPFKRADWMTRSPKWQMDNLFPNKKGSVTAAISNSWPSLGSPTFTWERYLGSEKQNSKTKPSHNSPGQEWQLKKYKKGDKNLINKEDAIEGAPVIVGFDSNDTDSHKSFFSDIVKYKMYQQEEIADFSEPSELKSGKSEKDKISNVIINNFNVPSHVENVYLYGQTKSSVYKDVNGKPAFPELMRMSFKPFRLYSDNAKNDVKITEYNKTQNIPEGYIWIDPEADYETKIVRIDPSTNIEFEEAKGEAKIKSNIKSFIKNKVVFDFSNDRNFNIDITKNNLVKESFTNLNEYVLENWNYTSDLAVAPTNRIQNNNTYNISIWSENSFRKYNGDEIFITDNNRWIEVSVVNKQWYYKEFYFDLKNPSFDIDYKNFINSKTSNDISSLYRRYLSNKLLRVPFIRPVVSTSTSNVFGVPIPGVNINLLPSTVYIYLDTLFRYRKYITTANGRKKLTDNSLIEVNNDKITKWFYLEDTYDKNNLPNFGLERKITINYDGSINITNGNLPVSIIDKQIPLYQIKAENIDFPYGKVIDPSKITNDELTKADLFSTGKYGVGDVENPQEIEVIKRYMLTDLDTESYYIIEGVLTDKNKQTENVKVGAGAGAPGAGYYKLPHAIGAAKVFLSFIVDIFTKLIPQITKLISLFKNPASFVTEILKEKMGEGFSIFSKESLDIFSKAKDNQDEINNKSESVNNSANNKKRMSDKIKELNDLFKNSPISNHVFVDRKGDYKFLLDGLALLPFSIFGKDLSFGMDMNFNKLPNGSPINLIFKDGLDKAKSKNIQDFLKPKLKDFRGSGSDGKAAGLNLSELKSFKDDPIYKSVKDKGKTNPNDSDILDIKYSTGSFINGVNYNYIYINDDVNSLLNDSNNILNTPNEAVDLEKGQKKVEELNDALKKDPTNKAIKDMIDKLKAKFRGLNDNSQPLLKMLLGFVTLPIKIIAGIIKWLMDFFKGLTNPLTLPSKIVELLSFSWLMKFFTPLGILDLAGVKFEPKKLVEWCALVKVPNPVESIKPPKIPTDFKVSGVPVVPTLPSLPAIPVDPSLPGVPTGFELPTKLYYNDASPKGRFLIPDDYEIADLNQVISMPFMPKLPTYTARQFRESCVRPVKLISPFLCLFEKIINGIIDFIWSTLGLEALIPPPHIKLCSKSPDPDVNDLLKIKKELDKDSSEPVKDNGDLNKDNEIPTDASFLYDITLDDGTVIKGLNYEDMQKYIKDHEDVGYDFKF